MKRITIYLDVSGANTADLHGGKSVNNSLRPYQLLTIELEKAGYVVKAARDILGVGAVGPDETGLLYAFHSHKKYRQYLKTKGVYPCAYYYLEPPVVKPGKYRALKRLTRDFKRVYLPNVDGVGYSTRGVDTSRLRRVFYPQAFDGKVDEYWNKTDRKFLIMVNANKRPSSKAGELYSKRIEAVVELSRFDAIDLYGMGWLSWRKGGSFYWPYLSNRKRVLSVYKGQVSSKYEALSDYTFSVCFENMAMPGYITEKIFDCLFVGTIPVYYGAPDITDYVPENCFIDMRKFPSYQALYGYLRSLTAADVEAMRQNIARFLETGYQNNFSTSQFIRGVRQDIEACLSALENTAG